MSNLNVRKSVYDLSNKEIEVLRDAFAKLYTQKLPHKPYMAYQEHAGILQSDGHYQRNDMLFLPWARAYFYNFERALQAVTRRRKQTVTLPYWDYTSKRAVKYGLPKLFSEPYYERKGKGGSKVIEVMPNPLYQAEYIIPFQTYREVNESTSLLEKAGKLAKAAFKQSNFIDFGTSIYATDIVSHSYIGGSSANTATTSYDPIFWFTHCQLDHFWWQWQQENPTSNDTVPNSVKKAKLNPFQLDKKAMKGADVLNTEDLGYTYD